MRCTPSPFFSPLLPLNYPSTMWLRISALLPVTVPFVNPFLTHTQAGGTDADASELVADYAAAAAAGKEPIPRSSSLWINLKYKVAAQGQVKAMHAAMQATKHRHLR